MARLTAAEKLDLFRNECHGTRSLLREFVDVSYKKFGGHSYSSGYLESLVVDILMELPKARREEVREQLSRKAYRMAVEAV
jgi:hypothetical protein